jgi:hypothetical protein
LKRYRIFLVGCGLDIVYGSADVMKAAPAAPTVQVFRGGLKVDVHMFFEGTRQRIEEIHNFLWWVVGSTSCMAAPT